MTKQAKKEIIWPVFKRILVDTCDLVNGIQDLKITSASIGKLHDIADRIATHYEDLQAKLEIPVEEEMTETQFKNLLLSHDWYYDRSDSHLAYTKGKAERDVIRNYATTPYFKLLYEHALTAVENGSSIEPFPSKAGTRDQPEPETQTPNITKTTMKLATEIINLLFSICFAPLIEAINANTAATAGGTATAPASASGGKTAKKKKITLDDCKEKAKEVTDKALRDHIKARFKSELGLNSMNDAKEDQLEAVLAIVTSVADGTSKPAASGGDDL